jgi:Ferric reductase like transmembrane component.
MTTWIILRAAGIGAYLMLFMSVAWGLVATTSVVTKRISKQSSNLFHQFVATVALLLLGVHLGGLLIDTYMKFHPLDVLVPMHARFKPVAVTFGVVAMYGMVIVLASSWARKPLGTKWWRALHLLAVPAFTLSMVHGVFSGTDTVRPWMWGIYLVTALTTLFLVIVRGLTHGYRPARAKLAPAHARANARQAVKPGDRPARRVTAKETSAPPMPSPPPGEPVPVANR